MAVLRPNKNGGVSRCSSPDHLVGKGRCNHIAGSIANLQYDKESKSYSVDVKDYDLQKKESDKEKIENISKYLDSGKKEISKEKREEIYLKIR